MRFHVYPGDRQHTHPLRSGSFTPSAEQCGLPHPSLATQEQCRAVFVDVLEEFIEPVEFALTPD
jgi:hypothetical protein